jgi:hypothetical protein
MLIHVSQMAALDACAVRAFENRTYAHLQQYFPRHCLLLGEPQMRLVVQHGWAKAKSYELTAEPCVRSYIEFMCLIGGGFDADPLLPWAAEILNDRSATSQLARADRLYDAVWDYIEHIVPDFRDSTGKPTTARFVTELRRLRAMPDEPLAPASLPRFTSDALDRLTGVFPVKSAHVGEAALTRVVADGVRAARSYGFGGQQASMLFIVLKFVLGAGFDRDPLLPWASATLNDPAIASPAKRLDKLYLEGAAFLRRWWDAGAEQAR